MSLGTLACGEFWSCEHATDSYVRNGWIWMIFHNVFLERPQTTTRNSIKKKLTKPHK